MQDYLLHDTDYDWRVEASKAGKLRAVGDLGTHWMDIIQFVTGLKIESVFTDLATFIPVRKKPKGKVQTFTSPQESPKYEEVKVDTEDLALVHSLARPLWDHIKEYEFFNLSEDPDQLQDIFSEEKEKTREMRLALGDWLAEQLKGAPGPLQLSVFRGGWLWEEVQRHWLKSSELAELLRNYPEVKRAL